MTATAKTLVVKQGPPSKSGEKVDTSAAKVIPPSSEVKSEAAAREVAAQKKVTGKKIGAAAKRMTGKPAAKPKAGNDKRLTMEWLSAKGQDVKVKDRVKCADGTVIDVVGRWSKRLRDGDPIPMVTGHVVSGGSKSKGARHNAVAAEATHVTKK